MVGKNAFAPGTDFAYSAPAADLVPLRFALGFVIERLFTIARESNWDDAASRHSSTEGSGASRNYPATSVVAAGPVTPARGRRRDASQPGSSRAPKSPT